MARLEMPLEQLAKPATRRRRGEAQPFVQQIEQDAYLQGIPNYITIG